ncbi:MAG: carboxypeptidase-like regulatory domain-containing protein [Candidatus Thermoplasmatota archaeon]
MRVLWMTIALLATTLAGCSGSNDPAAPSIDPGVDGLNATPTTGVIRGVVVDVGVVPIVGASVLASSGGKSVTATTNDVGGFGFDGLTPGSYFVKATKGGFLDGQTTVEVVAGVDEPPVTRIALEPDASFIQPYAVPYKFDGFIECSGSTVAISGAYCSFPNDLGLNLTDLGGPDVQCDNNPLPVPCKVFDDRFLAIYPLDGVIPTYAQSELDWTSTQSLGSSMSVMWSRDCQDDNAGFPCDDVEASGTSPLLITGDQATLAAASVQEGGTFGEELIGTNTLVVRVFNRGVEGSEAGGTFGVGVTFEQKFTVYTHMFYGYTPPAWRFTSGEPVPPPAP